MNYIIKKTMKKIIIFILCVAYNSINAQCINAPNGKYPNSTFTVPSSTGYSIITSSGHEGEYSSINVVVGNTYIFKAHNQSHFESFITITDSNNVIYHWGMGMVKILAPYTGIIRFYTHRNENCEAGISTITRKIRKLSIYNCPPAEELNLVELILMDSNGDGWGNASMYSFNNEQSISYGWGNFLDSNYIVHAYCVPDGCYDFQLSGIDHPLEASWKIIINSSIVFEGGGDITTCHIGINSICSENPNNNLIPDKITIEPMLGSNENDITSRMYNIKIIDIQGKTVYSGVNSQLINPKKYVMELNKKGIFIIQILDKNNNFVSRSKIYVN
jgi:hypothetical protein